MQDKLNYSETLTKFWKTMYVEVTVKLVFDLIL